MREGGRAAALDGPTHTSKADAARRFPPKENEMLRSFLRDETGLELSEYAVAAALIALAVVGIFTTLGGNITTVINNLASRIQ